MIISVIIPVRNAMPFLPEALDSITVQGYVAATAAKPFQSAIEVLIVDGGSSDGSLEAAAAFGQAQIIAQQGRGLAAARNQGLAAARGDLVAFLDADDRWPAGSLARRADYLARHPDSPCVIGHMQRFLAAGDSAAILSRRYDRRWLDQPAPGLTPGALLVRRGVMDDLGGFDESLAIGCDSDWFARAQDAGLGPALLPDIVLHKHIRGSRLSADVGRYRRELLTVARRSLQRRGQIKPPGN